MSQSRYGSALYTGVLLFLLAMTTAHGQLTTPFFAQDGMAAAKAKALETVGKDAKLLFVISFGNLDIPAGNGIPIPLSLTFYLDSAKGGGLSPTKQPGQADAWIYVFNSQDSAKTSALVALNLLGSYLIQDFGGALPIPAAIGAALTFSEPFASSGKMIKQLKTSDTAFIRFHKRLPGAVPRLVTFGQLVASDSVTLPVAFLNGPAWTVQFLGGGDSSMTCFVSAQSGETFCQQVTLPQLSVPSNPTNLGTASLVVAPNPGGGVVRVGLDLPTGSRADGSVTMILYNERGGQVLDLTPSLLRNGYGYAEFDASALPSGVYYCRASGTNWQGTTGIVVE